MYVRRESEQRRKQICHQKNKDAKGLITCDNCLKETVCLLERLDKKQSPLSRWPEEYWGHLWLEGPQVKWKLENLPFLQPLKHPVQCPCCEFAGQGWDTRPSLARVNLEVKNGACVF